MPIDLLASISLNLQSKSTYSHNMDSLIDYVSPYFQISKNQIGSSVSDRMSVTPSTETRCSCDKLYV